MRNAKRAIKSLACALALLANGAGVASAQQNPQRDKLPGRDVMVEKDHIVLAPAPQGGPTGSAQGTIIFGNPGEVSTMTFTWIASEMAFDSRVVRGAPFSAEAVTETNHALADGNRISRKTTSAIYRDSEGRTRRDEASASVGPFATSGEAHQTVFINDPVSGVNYVLHPRTRTVSRMSQHFTFERRSSGEGQGSGYSFSVQSGERGAGQRQPDASKPILAGQLNGRATKGPAPVYPAIARAAGAEGRVSVEVTVNEEGKVESARAVDGHPLLREAAVDAARQWEFAPTKLQNQPVKVAGRISFNFTLSKQETPAGMTPQTPPSVGVGPVRVVTPRISVPRFEESKESLGKQSIEGVEAEGTRTTVTIPAGAIGNERPILITSERWYSPELQLVVMTRHSDPRFGETTYRLTNLSRADPDRALFEVPTDYKVISGAPFERHIETLPARRPKNEQ